ncbi:MAG: hypothetical protein J7647_29580 [Cyanobacteria bacterium SBLK]|nr:hypothetical protein [Cyanobacteria bacterium SBLK]
MKAKTIAFPITKAQQNPNLRIQKNWCDRDRFSWHAELENLAQTNNTFVRAAISNTREHHPERYTTIAERSAYYAAIDALAATGVLPGKIRFFGAASQVTNLRNVGCIERQIGKILHSRAAIALLHNINKVLFEANMKMAGRLLAASAIIDPKNSVTIESISAIHFDLNMIEFEQSILDKYLQETLDKLPPEEGKRAIKDLNRDLNFAGAIGTILQFIVDTQPMQWAKEALAADKLNFLDRKHREAIGKAIVLSLHQTPFQEYKAHIMQGIIPPERLPEFYRTKRV